MAYNNSQRKMLEDSLLELRRIYDQTCNIFDQLRTKALALIVSEIAIVGFVFGSDGHNFKIPKHADERIFLGVGVVSLAVALGFLLWTISTVKWRFPHDFDNAVALLKKHHSSQDEYTEYLHDYYVDANNHNSNIISPKLKKFNWTVYMLAAGVIILLVVKYGGMTK